MEEYVRGMLAVSMAGHDRGRLYVIWEKENDTISLVDGELRTLARPKKKNRRHVQVIKQIPDEWKALSSQTITDEKVKYVLKCCRRQREAAKQG